MATQQQSGTTSPPGTDPLVNFPSLTPAYTFNFRIGGPASPVGGLTRGLPLTVVHLISGGVRSVSPASEASEGGVEEGVAVLPRLEATVRGQGIDYVRNDPDGGRMRLDAGVVVEDDEGNLIHIHYTGIVDITEQLTAILAGRRDARSTEFGNSFINITFETGCEKYKELERGLFVGAGRFIFDGRGLGVEYKVSRVGWRPP